MTAPIQNHMLLADRHRGVQLLSVALVSVLVSKLAIVIIPIEGGYASASLPLYFIPLKKLPRDFYLCAATIVTLFGADFFGHEVLSLATVSLLLHVVVMGLTLFYSFVE